MNLLITGIAVWCAVHLFPSVMPAKREALITRLGNNAYRGLFALVILASLVTIVLGWPKGFIDEPIAAILTLNTIAHTVGAIGVASKSTGWKINE